MNSMRLLQQHYHKQSAFATEMSGTLALSTNKAATKNEERYGRLQKYVHGASALTEIWWKQTRWKGISLKRLNRAYSHICELLKRLPGEDVCCWAQIHAFDSHCSDIFFWGKRKTKTPMCRGFCDTWTTHGRHELSPGGLNKSILVYYAAPHSPRIATELKTVIISYRCYTRTFGPFQ